MIDIIQDRIEDILSLLENVGYFLINERNKHQYQTYIKDDKSLLTDLDIASDLLIKDGLKSLFGNIAILSEENDVNDNINIAKAGKCFFLLDPLDGTKSFTNDGDFTINLAFCLNNKPTLSFIHSPTQKTMLFGNASKAFIRTNGVVKKLMKIKKNNITTTNISTNITHHQESINITCGSGFYNRYHRDMMSFLQQKQYNINTENIIVSPAMNKLFEFVHHNCDALISSNVCKDWDVLPAIPLLEAIGAKYLVSYDQVFANENFNQPRFCVAKNDVILEDLQSFLTQNQL